jgi:hypothetical protein
LALEIPDYLFILASATEAIEESFGAELAQVFSRHIESSFSDSAWNFTDFAEEFDQAVNKISK